MNKCRGGGSRGEGGEDREGEEEDKEEESKCNAVHALMKISIKNLDAIAGLLVICNLILVPSIFRNTMFSKEYHFQKRVFCFPYFFVHSFLDSCVKEAN